MSGWREHPMSAVFARPRPIGAIRASHAAAVKPEFAGSPARVRMSPVPGHAWPWSAGDLLVGADGSVAAACECHVAVVEDAVILGLRAANPAPEDQMPRDVFVCVGNSDDKLPQREWARLVSETEAAIRRWASRIHGVWFSEPASQWQNACFGFALHCDPQALRDELSGLCGEFGQDSISWLEGETVFLASTPAVAAP